ncbi:unnamed protein product [Urochloa decumbens]|uniref:Uncharacterized protein n=1 Tax=Urochloa decumbens TaxID=240449 RepID=A0ABC9E653_9POAL
MARAGAVPAIIVLALGAGVLGVPEALRLLIELAGRNAAIDIGIIVFLISMFVVQLLGNLQLVRFVRKATPAGGAGGARRGAPRAPAADPFARITLLLSLAAASLVAACLVLVSGGPGSVRPLFDLAADYRYPVVVIAAAGGVAILRTMHPLRAFREQRNARGRATRAERTTTTHHAARFIGLPLATAAVCALLVAGGLGSPSPLVDFAAKNSIVGVVVIGGATAAGSLLRTMHPLRAFREQRNARGGAARTERSATIPYAARSVGLPAAAAAAIALLVVATRSGACGGLDALALRLAPGFTDMAVAAVVGAALLVRFFNHRARNAAAVGGGVAAPAPAAAPRTRGASAR